MSGRFVVGALWVKLASIPKRRLHSRETKRSQKIKTALNAAFLLLTAHYSLFTATREAFRGSRFSASPV